MLRQLSMTHSNQSMHSADAADAFLPGLGLRSSAAAAAPSSNSLHTHIEQEHVQHEASHDVASNPFQDGFDLCKLYSCAGHLLSFWRQTQKASAAKQTRSSEAEKEGDHIEAADQPIKRLRGSKTEAERAQAFGGLHHVEDQESVKGHAQSGNGPWVVISLTDQLTHLTEVMKQPWQLRASQTQAVQDR